MYARLQTVSDDLEVFRKFRVAWKREIELMYHCECSGMEVLKPRYAIVRCRHSLSYPIVCLSDSRKTGSQLGCLQCAIFLRNCIAHLQASVFDPSVHESLRGVIVTEVGPCRPAYVNGSHNVYAWRTRSSECMRYHVLRSLPASYVRMRMFVGVS